jgi:hypothetical protein
MDAQESPDLRRLVLARAFLREATAMLLHPLDCWRDVAEKELEGYVSRATAAMRDAHDRPKRASGKGTPLTTA